MKPIFPYLTLLAFAIFLSSAANAAPATNALPTIAATVAGMRAMPGFFPLYWNEKTGELWLEVSRFDEDFIYYDALSAGLGSSELGMDRGEGGGERLLRFVRIGNKVLLTESNLAFRAPEGSASEQRGVRDSFPQAVLAGFTVTAEEGSRALVNATSFFLRDAHNVAARLRNAKQGSFSVDESRSAIYLPNTKNFARNTEVEVLQTFAGGEAGPILGKTLVDGNAFTVRLHHSFVALPPPGYAPRVFDPRAGYFQLEYQDYSAPLGVDMKRRFILRHRLAKKDPSAERSEAVEPIVYYLDPAAPEPIRGALLEGARWWNQAFEAAGYINAFRVEMLPEGADLMDVRYNVINWVHRVTRGWSYGQTVTDPRTGEILKGAVTLGSLRARQDYLIAEGLLAPYEADGSVSPEVEKMVLARMRQLAAHEVGHTLGLEHNFIASVFNRASVMDYPPPFAQLRADETVDLTEAYATGIGEWDKAAITYGYQEFSKGTDEVKALTGILDNARSRGLIFLTDQDARAPGSAHPQAHLWDTGTNAVDALEQIMALRRAVLGRFGEKVIKLGQPLATIEEALVPAYLMHRYELEAAAKFIGGMAYTYALRGDGQIPLTPVAPDEQRRALKAILETLTPENLQLPESLLTILPPRPDGYPRHRELFANQTGGVFDALAPAGAAAEMAFNVLLDPARAARLVEQNALNPNQPGLPELIDAILAATWRKTAGKDYPGELQRTVNYTALTHLIDLLANPAATPQTKAVLASTLTDLRAELGRAAGQNNLQPAQRAHWLEGARLIENYFTHPSEYVPLASPAPPPGQPIGAMPDCDY